MSVDPGEYLKKGISALRREDLPLAVEFFFAAIAKEERNSRFNVVTVKLLFSCFVSETKGLNPHLFDMDSLLGIARDDMRHPLSRLPALRAVIWIKHSEGKFSTSRNLLNLLRALSKSLLESNLSPSKKIITGIKVSNENVRFSDSSELEFVEYYNSFAQSQIAGFRNDVPMKTDFCKLASDYTFDDSKENVDKLFKFIYSFSINGDLLFVNTETFSTIKFLKNVERKMSNDSVGHCLAVFGRAILYYRLYDYENAMRKFLQFVAMGISVSVIPDNYYGRLLNLAIVYISFLADPKQFRRKQFDLAFKADDEMRDIVNAEDFVPICFPLPKAEVLETRISKCFNCETDFLQNVLKPCVQCRKAYFCSDKCLVESWPKHRSICREFQSFVVDDTVVIHSLIEADECQWNGCVRKIVGKNQAGKWEVEDFYGIAKMQVNSENMTWVW
ncbi:hypothetical protein HK100_002284 [Physocladia obscura]|uniref:MYND-type domain-containing protein n=1 Tax=Physocladia obscura TaxID=109957 RepID=A0AAD5XDY2_9FUNG|nr:hypothetical protein HK100_002284 [Physocladia obscura]